MNRIKKYLSGCLLITAWAATIVILLMTLWYCWYLYAIAIIAIILRELIETVPSEKEDYEYWKDG